jgi:hypothetical protein
VTAVDTYSQHYDPQSGDLKTERLVSCSRDMPGWLSALGIPSNMRAAEVSVVNASRRELVMRTRNITGSSLMVVEEVCRYTVHPENAEWTHYDQEARITAFLPAFSASVEQYGLSSFASQAEKGRAVMERLCDTFAEEYKDVLSRISLPKPTFDLSRLSSFSLTSSSSAST